MRKSIISIIIVAIIIITGVIIWWLFGMQRSVDKGTPQQEQVIDPVTTTSGKCALVKGKPTYTYNISELAVVDATYQIFDDTKTGERGLIPGGESIFWTTLDPEILVSINDGEKQTVTPTGCVVSIDSSMTNLKIEYVLSKRSILG